MMQGSLAERLRMLRAREGLGLVEASEKIGINRHTLRELELGKREPYMPTLRKLAQGYGVPVEGLVGEAPVTLGKAQASPSPAEAMGVEVQTYSFTLDDVAKAAASPADDEKRRSAELELERLQRQEMEQWEREDLEERLREERDERLAGSVRLLHDYTEALEMIMEKDPDTATVKALVEVADEMAGLGFGAYVRLNPDERDSEEVGLGEFEAAFTKLINTTERMVGQQEAREKDEGERGELIQLHQRVASRRTA